jgi:hypothetical protein
VLRWGRLARDDKVNGAQSASWLAQRPSRQQPTVTAQTFVLDEDLKVAAERQVLQAII